MLLPEKISEIEKFYQKKFKDTSVEPSKGLWVKLEKILNSKNHKLKDF